MVFFVGADHIINYKDKDFVEEVKAHELLESRKSTGKVMLIP